MEDFIIHNLHVPDGGLWYVPDGGLCRMFQTEDFPFIFPAVLCQLTGLLHNAQQDQQQQQHCDL
jgi:hypothetical protein